MPRRSCANMSRMASPDNSAPTAVPRSFPQIKPRTAPGASYALIRRRDFVPPPPPAPQDSGRLNQDAGQDSAETAAALAADRPGSERGRRARVFGSMRRPYMGRMKDM
jgi:hypothetical protein